MPDRRKHRGADPEDADLFAPPELERLHSASGDLVWLLNREYAARSALKLVGDRHALRARQRLALLRSVCTSESLARRQEREVDVTALAAAELVVDGFNLLATIESALGGAVVLRGRDGCFRDIGGIHGSYRAVAETLPALEAVGSLLAQVAPADVLWLLDSPVSNSGRLGVIIREIAGAHGWPWRVEIPHNPDRVLRDTASIVATSDGPVLDAAARWVNLARRVVESAALDAWIVAFADNLAD